MPMGGWNKALLIGGGIAGGTAGYGLSSALNKRRRPEIVIRQAAYNDAMANYDKGDVWDNPDEVAANKEFKAFHSPKSFGV